MCGPWPTPSSAWSAIATTLPRSFVTPEADARTALAEFALPAAAVTLSPLGGGHINRSWRVSMEGSGDKYPLQRLNPQVFRPASAIMQNVRAVTHRLGE